MATPLGGYLVIRVRILANQTFTTSLISICHYYPSTPCTEALFFSCHDEAPIGVLVIVDGFLRKGIRTELVSTELDGGYGVVGRVENLQESRV